MVSITTVHPKVIIGLTEYHTVVRIASMQRSMKGQISMIRSTIENTSCSRKQC